MVHTALFSRSKLPDPQTDTDEATLNQRTPLADQVLAWNVPLGKGGVIGAAGAA